MTTETAKLYTQDDLLNFFSFGRLAETNGISFATHLASYHKFRENKATPKPQGEGEEIIEGLRLDRNQYREAFERLTTELQSLKLSHGKLVELLRDLNKAMNTFTGVAEWSILTSRMEQALSSITQEDKTEGI